MEVSDDGGQTYDYACTQVSGDIGNNINTGNGKTITWQHDTEHGSSPSGDNFIIKIVADDIVGDEVYHYGQIYSTVTIGDQVWFKENLNVGTRIDGSQNMTDNGVIEKYCYDDNPANCVTYGGLYLWKEIMEYDNSEYSQGVCPDGWHIPSENDFRHLKNLVNDDGNVLKSVGKGSGAGAGTNTTDFSALLEGYFYAGDFYDIDIYTSFWSSKERAIGEDLWFTLEATSNTIYFGYSWDDTEGYAVRCLRNDPPAIPIQLLPSDNATSQSMRPTLNWENKFNVSSYTLQVAENSSFTPTIVNESNITDNKFETATLSSNTEYFWRVLATNNYGSFGYSYTWSFETGEDGGPCPGTETVDYGGQTYNTVMIGAQCWLKENLNVGTRIDGSQDQADNATIEKYCYDDNENNCDEYGGLYQWDEMMQYTTTEGTQGICPTGWHIPSSTELTTLTNSVSDDGNALKAVGEGSGAGAGTNISSFTALFSGHRSGNLATYGQFGGLESSIHLWSSSQFNLEYADLRYMDDADGDIDQYGELKTFGFAVRCIKD
ncbi:sclb protein [hydrocarbon metagenome]|uniref:Sclb protein n=1 Tax=hydrocarbon metagenome TaxID=938273 RepID=A0A0W8FYH6_9ZZZZ